MRPSRTKRTAQNRTDLTAAQALILDKFATIQAELECLLRETQRARAALHTKRALGKHDRPRLFAI